MGNDAELGASFQPDDVLLADVVSAVVDVLSESGPDAVHLTSIARRCGQPMSAMREIYGHPGELLFVAWDRRLRSEFDTLVRQAHAILLGRHEGSSVVSGLSPERRAAVHLLVVAHRYDELREVLPFDVQRILYAHEGEPETDAERSVFRALIGWLLGIALEPGQRYGDSLRLLSHIGWRRDVWKDVQALEPTPRTPALSLVFDEMGEMSQEILGACTRIVAQGGFGRATLLRIARMAGYPSEVLYGLYGRQEHLIAEYMKSVFALLFSYRRFEEYMNSPAHATMRLEVWLEPDMQIRRRALLESVMASNFSPLLESAFCDAADGALADMRLANLDLPEDELEVSCVRFIASRQVSLGLALLDDVEVDRWRRDWSAFLHVFLSTSN